MSENELITKEQKTTLKSMVIEKNNKLVGALKELSNHKDYERMVQAILDVTKGV